MYHRMSMYLSMNEGKEQSRQTTVFYSYSSTLLLFAMFVIEGGIFIYFSWASIYLISSSIRLISSLALVSTTRVYLICLLGAFEESNMTFEVIKTKREIFLLQDCFRIARLHYGLFMKKARFQNGSYSIKPFIELVKKKEKERETEDE